MISLTRRAKELALAEGASMVGVASVNALSRSPKGHQPQDFLPETKTLISIGMRMDRATMLNLPKTLEEYKTLYDTTNTKLNSTAKRIAQFLRNQGYDALPIAASCRYDRKELIGDLSHKHVAVAAGLGKFGINNLVLTPEHGPCVRFATVLTSAPLRIDKPLDTNQCLGSKCMKCVKICPAGALENPKFDPEEGWQIGKKKCYQYMHETLGGELCGLCIKVCPVGSKESNNH